MIHKDDILFDIIWSIFSVGNKKYLKATYNLINVEGFAGQDDDGVWHSQMKEREKMIAELLSAVSKSHLAHSKNNK